MIPKVNMIKKERKKKRKKKEKERKDLPFNTILIYRVINNFNCLTEREKFFYFSFFVTSSCILKYGMFQSFNVKIKKIVNSP